MNRLSWITVGVGVLFTAAFASVSWGVVLAFWAGIALGVGIAPALQARAGKGSDE